MKNCNSWILCKEKDEKQKEYIKRLEGQLRFAAGYISTTKGFTDKHPEDVLQWLGIEWDKIQQYDDQVYNQKRKSPTSTEE